MGAMFRSEEMRLCQLFIQPEAAYQSVSDLGEMGTVQIRDLNEELNVFQRKFVNEVRRCDELERKLRYIEAEMVKDEVKIPDIRAGEDPRAPNPREIIDLEAHLEKTEREIVELSENAVGLKSTFLELTELRHVLEKAQNFFQEQEGLSGVDMQSSQEDSTQVIRGRLGFVAGVIPRERVAGFERMLWRISRGNVFLRQAELEEAFEDPATGHEIRKTVFVAFFQGEQLKNRVKKICAGFHASIYNCPNMPEERAEMLAGLCTRLEDLNMVLNQTKDHRHRVLTSLAGDLNAWIMMIRKMKAIYHALNMFNMDVTKKCMIAECWVPIGDIASVRKTLADGGIAAGSSIESFMNVIDTNETPPTFNRVNKFTRGFQNLIEAYGVASYREVNPALYTIIIFPFLFAIMFGDMGHGAIMMLFGLFMVVKEKKFAKKSDSEIWNIFFGGRYIILLMGIFSIYTGFIYNDLFSKSMDIFGSSWTNHYTLKELMENSELSLDPAKGGYTLEPYPIGVDPVWQLALNKIIFLNSYKMKLSIIIGVIHMIFGVCLSVVNHIHFKSKVYIVLEFIPQLLFLVLLFAWMVAMMLMKWLLYAPDNPLTTSPRCAPSVLIMFINMMLMKSTEPFEGCNEWMFDAQPQLQTIFLVIALLCIPVMLLGKPLYIQMTRKSKAGHRVAMDSSQEGLEMKAEEGLGGSSSSVPHGEEEEEEPMSEIYIHQAIHTIEYVLSTVSHTASYLRLWALSLAHSQLSEVLWNMVLKQGLGSESYVGGVMIYVVFWMWSLGTLAILVMMEGLSAFLHTLRLHWVEFMSKFYVGQGYAFQPFCFKAIFEIEDEED